MEGLLMDVRTTAQLADEWIQAIVGKDFDHIMDICQPDVKSNLLVPKQLWQLENALDLSNKVKGWFNDYDSIEILQTRAAMVGEKLGIFYRFRCVENGSASQIEQQIYCHLNVGVIDRLWLVCSGFQPEEAPARMGNANQVGSSQGNMRSTVGLAPHADALLEFQADESHGSTCALLTPFIKQKLAGMTSGQVLEVHVDDITAKEDIEAWSRLSGNPLLKMEQVDGQDLVFFISKK